MPEEEKDITEGTTGTEDFLKAIQGRIFGDGGIVSSQDTGAEQFASAVAGTKKAGAAGAERIESAFGREKEFQAGQFGQQRETFREAGRGFARNNAALQQLDERTEKSLRDLEQRKQELLLAGEESTARQVSQLLVKELEFKQQAQQQHFTNLLNLGGFGIKVMEEQRKAEAAATLPVASIQTFVDENGDVVAKNKVTGETLWTATGIGRAGLASPNITVNPIADPVTGNFKYTEVRDKGTGEVRYLDASGKEVPPEDVQIDQAQDPLDIFISGLMEEIVSGITEGI